MFLLQDCNVKILQFSLQVFFIKFFVSEMFGRTIVFLLIGLLAWVYSEMRPPLPKLCGLSPGGPPVTGPRIKLRDGRHLAYMELGASKDVAKYKIILVHAIDSSKYDTVVSKVTNFAKQRTLTLLLC